MRDKTKEYEIELTGWENSNQSDDTAGHFISLIEFGLSFFSWRLFFTAGAGDLSSSRGSLFNRIHGTCHREKGVIRDVL